MTSRPPSANTTALTLAAIGVVYGDIGTSPLYTMKETFSASTGVALTPENLVGAVSVIFWALMLVVTLKYVILVLRANNEGEGGVIALLALALRAADHRPGLRSVLVLAGLFGAALFYGDSVITPAISVLSAVEGLEVAAPGLGRWALPLAAVILIGLFAIQRHGTGAVGRYFGPVIVVWFAVLALTGLLHILEEPRILAALNPFHALQFLMERGPAMLLALGAIVLALTGAEALYADLGHFGHRPIRIAWTGFVLPALALNYLGQGALLMAHPEALENPFYHLFPQPLLLPAVALATLVTIIASQATISGAYSMTRQCILLGFLPRMHILHTSSREEGQIYLPVVNWAMLAGVMAVVLGFGNSSAMASAYGLAVTLTMFITTFLTYFVVRHVLGYPLWAALGATGFFLVVDGLLVASTSLKFLHGGWFPLLLGALILTVMTTWKRGRELVLRNIRQADPRLDSLIASLGQGGDLARVERTAVFPVADPETAPQALMHNLKHNRVLHTRNVVLTVRTRRVPWVAMEDRVEVQRLSTDFWRVRINYGFKNALDVPQALELCKVYGLEVNPFETSYFLSRETVVPSPGDGMAPWREHLFAALFRNAGSVVEHFRIPSNAVIELGTRVHI